MFFFIKPSVIHLDCFTQDVRVHKFYPIAPSAQFLPEWWRKLPKTYTNKKIWWGTPTIKSCPGFTEYYKNSITIPLWCDLIIDIAAQGQGFRWQFADEQTSAVVHDEEQYTDFIDTRKYSHFKITSPWCFKTKKSVKWAWNFPIWNHRAFDSLAILPAVIDYRYNYTTNINIIINKSIEQLISLNAGIPLVNLIPMSDKRVEIHNHIVSKDEYEVLNSCENVNAHFFNRHRKNIKDIDRIRVCPFRFDNR